MANDFNKYDYGNGANAIGINGNFHGGNLLKLIQEGRSTALWVDLNGIDLCITKGIKPGGEWKGGLNIEKSYMVDPGTGASAGFDLVNGRFAKGDFSQHTKYTANLKHSTLTLEWQNQPYESLFDSETKAYSSPKEEQFKYKVQNHRSIMTLMSLTDGTGRLATVSGVEGRSTGLSIIKAAAASIEYKPVKLDIDSTSFSAVGSIAHLYETLVISIVGVSYDEDNNGTKDKTIATCIPRLLMLGFREENTADAPVYYDAFRIVRVEVTKGYIEVNPGRIAELDSAAVNGFYMNSDLATTKWCAHTGNAANGLQIFPAWGRPCDPSIASGKSMAAAISTHGFQAVFAPAVAFSDTTFVKAAYLYHPGFIVPIQDKMRQCLGLGWSLTTDLGLLNPYWSTGIRALLSNVDNTVHGMKRPLVPMFLPTDVDMAGGVFTADGFIDMVVRHTQRNRNKKLATNIIPVNPILYGNLIKQLGDNKLIHINDKINLGESGGGGISITMFNTRYDIIPCTEMPLNFIPIMEKGAINMYDGKMKDVAVSGADTFLKLHPDYNERINVSQRYKFVSHELTMFSPRDAAYMFNFTMPV